MKLKLVKHEQLWDFMEEKMQGYTSQENILDIKDSLDEGVAKLFSCGDDFIVIAPAIRERKDGLLLWFAYSMSGCAIKKYEKDIDLIAKEFGAKFIEFWTDRDGFERIVPKLNYKKAYTVWRLEL